MKIIIAGLGPGSARDVSAGTLEALQSGLPVYLRTCRHPLVPFLEERQIAFESFDWLYEQSEEFEQVYRQIAQTLVEQAQAGQTLLYAVPGHPFVAEKSVEFVLELAQSHQVATEVWPAMSFLDAVFVSVGHDVRRGFCLLDALDFSKERLNPCQDTVFTQIYDSLTASELKVALLERWPDEHPAHLIGHAGIPGEEVKVTCPLWQIDQAGFVFDHLSCLYLPKAQEKPRRDLEDLLNIIRRLRSSQGCPWDRKQTRQSLKEQFLEEAQEVARAIEANDLDNLVEELGDVLLHLGFQTVIGEEESEFGWLDVTEEICAKMVRRHPHVFGGLQIEEKDLPALWKQIKKAERIEKTAKNE